MIAVVLGTRPEAIKLWPVILELRKRKLGPVKIISTQQQRDLLPPILDELELYPDFDLEYDRYPDVPLTGARLAAMIAELSITFSAPDFELVIVQGDTMTTLAGALAAFYAGIPVAHVEAGLRSYDLTCPFPEEGNRRMIGQIATLQFAPTKSAYMTAGAERRGPSEYVALTGNTIVDAFTLLHDRADAGLYRRVTDGEPIEPPDEFTPADVLVTVHRRESWPHIPCIVRNMALLAGPTRRVRWVMHPAVAAQIEAEAMKHATFGYLELRQPMGYMEFLAELAFAGCVVTDSGGVIEEATVFAKPLIVLRDKSERHEALYERVLPTASFEELERRLTSITSGAHQWALDGNVRAFGDGTAAKKIVDVLEPWLAKRRASP